MTRVIVRGNRASQREPFHAVRFYKDVDALSPVVADFIARGLAQAQPAVIIATPLHCAAIEKQLIDRGVDLMGLKEQGVVTLLDAASTMSQFMVDGMPDPTRFRETIAPVIEKAAGERTDAVVRAYGEMVDLLWKAGQTAAAMRLENLWNSLSSTHAFSLLCGYAIGNCYHDTAIDDICSRHSHVMSASGDAALIA